MFSEFGHNSYKFAVKGVFLGSGYVTMPGLYWKRFTSTTHVSSKRSVITYGIIPPGIAAVCRALGLGKARKALEETPLTFRSVNGSSGMAGSL